MFYNKDTNAEGQCEPLRFVQVTAVLKTIMKLWVKNSYSYTLGFYFIKNISKLSSRTGSPISQMGNILNM